MADFCLFIFENLAKINEKRFFHSVKRFSLKNTHVFLAKIQNGGRKSRWHRVDFSEQKFY
jgi:hypothetical protein